MADLAITAAQVLPVAGSTVYTWGVADVALVPGNVVWFDPSTQTWKLFDANDATANTKTPRVVMTTSGAGQPVAVATGGDVVIGAAAAPAAGTVYVASATAGKICPAADLASGMTTATIGVGKTGNKIALNLVNSGAAVP